MKAVFQLSEYEFKSQTPAALLPSQLLASMRGKEMEQGPHAWTLATRAGLVAPGFGLTQPRLLWHWGVEIVSVSPSDS